MSAIFLKSCARWKSKNLPLSTFFLNKYLLRALSLSLSKISLSNTLSTIQAISDVGGRAVASAFFTFLFHPSSSTFKFGSASTTNGDISYIAVDKWKF